MHFRTGTRYHLAFAYHEADQALARATMDLLVGRWRVFDPERPLGEDAEEARRRALAGDPRTDGAAWVVVFLSAESGDALLRSDTIRALEAREGDPHGRRILPVVRPGFAFRREAYSNLNLLQHGECTTAEEAARAIEAVAQAEGLAWWGETAVPVVVVAALADLKEEAEAVAATVRAIHSQVSAAEIVDPGQADAPERIAAARLSVVLLGASTSGERGEAVLRACLGQADRTVAAKMKRGPDDFVRHMADMARAMPFLADARWPEVGTLDQLRATVREAVARRLAEILPRPAGGLPSLTADESRYLAGHRDGWRDGRVGTFARYTRYTLGRSDLYVSLHASGVRIERREDESEAILESRTDERKRDTRPAFLDELLTRWRRGDGPTVVVSEAGTGKTVLLQHLAWSLDRVLQGEPLPAAAEEGGLDLRGQLPLPTPVPVLVEAAQLARVIQDTGAASPIEVLLARLLGLEQGLDEVRERLAQGRYWLLVDSLDEVPGLNAKEAVLRALEKVKHPRRVLLSTRPVAHTGVRLGEPWIVHHIAPLDGDRRAAFIERWFLANPALAGLRPKLELALEELEDRLPEDPDGSSPLLNPLLLRCVLVVFSQYERLPDSLAQLYDEMVDILCEAKDPSRTGSEADDGQRRERRERTRHVLQQIALAMQLLGGTRASLDRVAEALVADKLFERTKTAAEEVDRLAARTGVLLLQVDEGGSALVRPWHRSFQEYLAACALAAPDEKGRDRVRALGKPRDGHPPVLYDPEQVGCLRFATGAFGQKSTPSAQGWVQGLVDESALAPREQRGRLLALAASGLAEYGAEFFDQHPLLWTLPPLVAEGYEAGGESWSWRDRLLALDALGRLGDPRLEVPRAACDRGWVALGPAEVPLASERLTVKLPRLWVRRWPVTVAELQAFVEDQDGWCADRWWDRVDVREGDHPDAWNRQLRHPNRPVVEVDWWAARAFCRWAKERWKLPVAGGVVDLPTGREWEAVARLEHRGTYPWGEADPGREETARAAHDWGGDPFRSAVPMGAFPLGHTSGLCDLAGNVWEWTASTLDNVDCRVVDMSTPGSSARVLRGGSWFSVARYLRCDYRYRGHPGLRDGGIGFRVVVRGPPARRSGVEG